MSTFLELCVDVRRECGITGSGPLAVTNQSGELARVVEWTAAAYTLIQNRHNNWRWLRSSFTLPTVDGTDSYAYTSCTDTGTSAAITRFRRWYPHDFKIYLTSAGSGTEHWLLYQQWDDFRSVYKVGTQNEGYPAWVAINPTNRIVLGPIPDAVYTVAGDYQKSAQTLAADSDEPEMPADFHQLIVFEAMRKYAAFNGASEVWAHAKDEASRLWQELRQDQLPPSGYGDPIA